MDSEQEKTGIGRVSSCLNYVVSPVFKICNFYSLLFMRPESLLCSQIKALHQIFTNPTFILSLCYLSFHDFFLGVCFYSIASSLPGLSFSPKPLSCVSCYQMVGRESGSCACPGLRRNDQFPRSPSTTTNTNTRATHHQQGVVQRGQVCPNPPHQSDR